MADGIRAGVEDGVMILAFARPEKKNAITNAMYGLLADGLARAQGDDAIRTVLLTSEGDSFTAGNDLGDFAAQNAQGDRGPLEVFRFLDGLAALDKPLVAGVEGRTVGIGLTMLLHCDLVYVAADAMLSVPFVDLAVSPEAASSLLLPTRIGHARAYAMFALGQVIDGATAAAWGIASDATPPGQARARAIEAAHILAAKPAGSLKVTKRLMRDGAALTERMELEAGLFRERLMSDEAREAFAAFFERRTPDFRQFGQGDASRSL